MQGHNIIIISKLQVVSAYRPRIIGDAGDEERGDNDDALTE